MLLLTSGLMSQIELPKNTDPNLCYVKTGGFTVYGIDSMEYYAYDEFEME